MEKHLNSIKEIVRALVCKPQSREWSLELVVFVCGAVVMIYELVGSRLVAPHLGTSVHVWTSLIGVVLASLSAGYYLGGRLADRHPYKHVLAGILLLASICIAVTAARSAWIASRVVHPDMPLELGSVLVALALFAPASILLGMVSPYAARLRVMTVETTGSRVGSLYALSTLGSITGTFMAGFYIIPRLGSSATVFMLAGLVYVMSLVLLGKRACTPRIGVAWGIAGAIILLSFVDARLHRAKGVIDIDTEYSRIQVYPGIDWRTKKPILNLRTDPFATQSARFTDGTDDLVFPYAKFYRMADVLVPHSQRALAIGGCAYTQPRDYLKRHPSSTIDVVEIDPGMTRIAREFFELTDDPRLRIIEEDGRIFLNKNQTRYDTIFMDAFLSDSVPYQLTTLEAVKRIHESLSENGAAFVNLISAIDGERGQFTQAQYATYKRVFPHVYLFPVYDERDLNRRQNIVLVALKQAEAPSFQSTNNDLQAMLNRRWNPENMMKPMPVLTDDFAPVEAYQRASM